MATMLSLDQATAIIRSAFLPLRCGVEVFDYEQKIRFRVFDDDDKAVLTVREMKASLARSRSELADLLQEARRRVAKKGHELQPWELR